MIRYLSLAHGQDVLAGIVGARDDDGIGARGNLLVVFGPEQVAVTAEGLVERTLGVNLSFEAGQELVLPVRLMEDCGFVVSLDARYVGDEEIDEEPQRGIAPDVICLGIPGQAGIESLGDLRVADDDRRRTSES